MITISLSLFSPSFSSPGPLPSLQLEDFLQRLIDHEVDTTRQEANFSLSLAAYLVGNLLFCVVLVSIATPTHCFVVTL